MSFVQLEIQVNPDQPKVGQAIEFTATFTNPLANETGPVDVEWTLDGIQHPGVHESIPAFGEATLSWSTDALLPGEHHEVALIVNNHEVRGSGSRAFKLEDAYVIKDASGKVLHTGPAKEVKLTARQEVFSWFMKIELEPIAIYAKLFIGVDFDAYQAARDFVANHGVTVAIGLTGNVMAELDGIGTGFEAGAGLFLGSNGDDGWYYDYGVDWGGTGLGLSGQVQTTVILGPPDDLAGPFIGYTGSAGELVVGGGAILYSPTSHKFMGVTSTVGIGGGSLVNWYETYTNTTINHFG